MSTRRKTTEEFILEATKVHKGRYSYEEVVYINGREKVKIKCKKHGEFVQAPAEHIKGKGCSKCSGTCKNTTEGIIKDFKKVHGDFYDYSKVEYVNNTTKVIIKCPLHGEFKQSPKSHKRGEGCNDCGRIRTTEVIKIGFYNIIRAERHKEEWEKTPCILYFVRLYNEEESFFIK